MSKRQSQRMNKWTRTVENSYLISSFNLFDLYQPVHKFSAHKAVGIAS